MNTCIHKEKKKPSELRLASTLLNEIDHGLWASRFETCYGKDSAGQRARYRGLLEAFVNTYGDRGVIITRAPGRLNLMGRHIDHRGGCSNVMVIGNDTVMVCSPRDNDAVHIANLSGLFPEAEFGISSCLALGKGAKDWLSFLESEGVRASLAAERGHWVTYIKSAVLRFQMAVETPLRGMDVMVTGNIPTGAGLSSSSSLVVAVAEALVALNGLELTDRQFVDLCGEGEWYVGSRGGAGDHAAMKFGRAGQIVQLKFKPFGIGGSYPWPQDCGIVVAESGEQAKKSEGSRDAFNERVATYEFGFMLLRQRFPQYGWGEFRDIADVTPQADIYRLLKALPERITRRGLLECLPNHCGRLQEVFGTHTEPSGGYDPRGVMLYGISECLRARQFGTLLEQGDYAAIGEMMKTSHDGDRLMKRSFSDAVLEGLYRQDADVSRQCGAYACSTERIDRLCDLLNSTEGVLGSSLVGAGLGGSVIALVRKASAETVLNRLKTEFYQPLGLRLLADCYEPGHGSSVWR